jgi:hypothetical protein
MVLFEVTSVPCILREIERERCLLASMIFCQPVCIAPCKVVIKLRSVNEFFLFFVFQNEIIVLKGMEGRKEGKESVSNDDREISCETGNDYRLSGERFKLCSAFADPSSRTESSRRCLTVTCGPGEDVVNTLKQSHTLNKRKHFTQSQN